MVNVMRFALGFNNPHRNRWIRKMAFIKMKDSFLSDNIQNLLHDSPLSYMLFTDRRAPNPCRIRLRVVLMRSHFQLR